MTCFPLLRRALPISLLIVSMGLESQARTPPPAERPVAPQNLVAGLKASYDPKPDYRLSTDDLDPYQLTDGYYETESTGELLWTRKEQAVAWSALRKPILISFDLGAKAIIGGVRLNAASSSSGRQIYWPAAVAILVSDDGINWSYAGELLSLSGRNGTPNLTGYEVYSFETNGLAAEGRHVALAVHPGGSRFLVAEEVEIHAAPKGTQAAPLPMLGDAEKVQAYLEENRASFGITRRLQADASTLRRLISQDDSLPSQEQARLLERLQKQSLTVEPGAALDFRTVLPLNAQHEALLAIHGDYLQAKGVPAFFVSKQHRYDYLKWMQLPEPSPQEPVTLSFSLMKNEARGDLFLATNASAQTMKLTCTLEGSKAGYTLFYIPWTDTPQHVPEASALFPASQTEEGWEVSLPPGTTVKLWLYADAQIIPVGTQTAVLRLTHQKTTVSLPIRTTVSAVTLGKPYLHLGMFDYFNLPDGYGAITPQNRDSATTLMQSHYVDSPWANNAVLALPDPADFDEEDQLLRPLNFEKLDAWLAQWPDARRYMVFRGKKLSFPGVPMTSPRFAKRIEAWAKALSAHLKSKGIQPGQFHLLLEDEPKTDAADRALIAWAKPIKQVAPEISIWSDPLWPNPKDSAYAEALELPDVLVPNASTRTPDGASSYLFYQDLPQSKELYRCEGLVPHDDPTRYFRLLPWRGWALRIQGISFWSLGTLGGSASSFEAYGKTGYGARSVWFSPLFIDRDRVYDSLHWQAVREGILDYEYLHQLEKALPGLPEDLKTKAKELLSLKFLDQWTPEQGESWLNTQQPGELDLHREKVLALLEQAQTRR